MKKVSAAEEFAKIDAFWSPRQVGELNGQLVKFVRLKGQFEWHKHTGEDEMFLVLEGSLTIKLRGQDIVARPRRILHHPARGGAHARLPGRVPRDAL